jgi:methyl-accepting chemotaxis protein
MSFTKKLLLGPLIAVVAVVLLSAVMLRSIARVHDSANSGTATTVPNLVLLGNAKDALWTMRIDIARLLSATDSNQNAGLEAGLLAAKSTIDQVLKDYETRTSDDQDKVLLEADRTQIDRYAGLVRQAESLVQAGKHVEAESLIKAKLDQADATLEALQAHYAYDRSRGEAAEKEAARTLASAVRLGGALALATLGLIGAVGYLVLRQSMRQLGGEPARAVEIAGRLAAGDFSTAIALQAGDATSLLATVSRLQQELSDRAEAERTALAASARIQTALDRVAVGVMLADTDGKIVYSNDFAAAIFRTRAAQIRSQLPQFDPDRIVGQSFDLFHRSAAHQRNMLAGLTGNHTTDVEIGGVTLRISANPVLSRDGQRLGTVVQWQDRTQEVSAENEIKSTVASAVAGDLTVRIPEAGKEGFFKALAGGMNGLIANMAGAVRQMGEAAAEVRSGADEISRGNLNLSQRTEEQASSLEQTAASMEQMTSTVKNNADNAAQANQLSAAAREQAERGGKVVGSAVLAMSEINAASKKIADIIGVIDEIAFQTNLLALNAAVEAARAGEQGRGFAVVASEVRNLASRSAAAAKEIKSLIQDSVGKVTEGSRLVDESGQVLAEIVTGVKKVTDVVAEIAASSREQASGIDQVNKAVTSMDATTQQNAALVEQASAAAQALNEQSIRLTQLIEHYRVGDEPSTSAASKVPTPRTGSSTLAAKSAPAAPRAERRSANRPWSNAANATAPAAPPAKTATGAGNEWDEF